MSKQDNFKDTLVGKVIDNTRRINVIEKFLVLLAFFMVVAGSALVVDGNNRRDADRQTLGGGLLAIVGVIGVMSLMSGDREGNAVNQILTLAREFANLFAQNMPRNSDNYSSFAITKR
jgi:hypothetical protein